MLYLLTRAAHVSTKYVCFGLWCLHNVLITLHLLHSPIWCPTWILYKLMTRFNFSTLQVFFFVVNLICCKMCYSRIPIWIYYDSNDNSFLESTVDHLFLFSALTWIVVYQIYHDWRCSKEELHDIATRAIISVDQFMRTTI